MSAIRQILDQAGRRDYTVKVYPNGSHNLMEVPPDNPNEQVRLKRFPPGFFETMEYAQVEKAAETASDDPNNWCRKTAISQLGEGHALSKNELLYQEIALLRFDCLGLAMSALGWFRLLRARS